MTLGGIALATDFAIVVVAATLLGVLARKTRQPAIVAYLLTGIVVGPVLLGIVTEDELIEIMAELGLGFLLFVLGIEMRFERIKHILRSIVNIAVGQTVLQTALALAVAYALGFREMDVIVIALATVFGATPVIVKLLDEQGQIKTLPGRIDVGVLIVQDIYLVVVLALVGAGLTGPPAELAVDAAVILGLLVGLGVAAYLAYRYLLPRVMRVAAEDHHVLFIVCIAWAFVFIYVAESLDVTVEVGGFLAGLSLAQLPYSTEIKERMRPVTDFFLVVFFASIGLQLTADNLLAYWQEALVASAVMMVGNFLIMFYLIDREQFTPKTSFIGSVNMVQVSEFSLVVGALAVTQELIDEDVLGYLGLMALVTMSLSTYVIVYNERLYERAKPYLERFESEEKSDTDLEVHEDHAVVVGYDDLTREALSVLCEHFEDVVVVDRSPRNVEALSTADVEYAYGDFKHGDVRTEADLANAAFVLSASRNPEVGRRIVEETPAEATVLVSATTATDAEVLLEEGATYVIVENALAGEALADLVTEFLTDREAFSETVRELAKRIEGGESGGD
ncbi:cation:proton antiporter [Natronorarus salvus]|uniref:cation:proton antiporter n=1 Tax=Natronorarus salvus TaxID=3117733 RepID=UPI002F268760